LEETLSKNHHLVAPDLNRFAESLRNQGKFDEAKVWFVNNKTKSALENKHPDVAQSLIC
jgi:hypothetical protein